MVKSQNITWHDSEVTKNERQEKNGHKSVVLWFTGLSGSGKSTISVALEKALFERGVRSYRLDGDNIRHGLNNNLGFSPEDRKENIRRIGEVSKLLSDAGLITLTAFISPYREDRDHVREILEDGEFVEVYTKASVAACEERDPKQLYKKVRAGEIKNFTGIDAPYEAPEDPEIIVDTEENSVEEAVEQIIQYLEDQKVI
ncbi:adenylyl-sulfate kinase [Staphylococcus carnosus]|uniref:Adenylyl-sulfate kinase n=1 Tax=Staphylococcus carnosus (strain TM300) TaxID=396513 RepID=CYSC_STACT|nr:adenylyl-sulfate kinase [Staphylococcus carnosus]B9DLK2.1 RecName: Full=Adenylyl-sulfate kinase; AltName: Full=APS kinase; AltName: Full=ATP adenosine-5'-phosphosulfate 3'-phosphotransferase; AltName: Full=Adenosine-5'-phosphosulfate kinase [Staphylococcus carnosus subsp. carnosus TM300]QPT03179.1 adenylyl-sulfate kinase [Staphylococcus carnosus]UQA68182.1 adenylyl-sulfate kinase [Staphylococcus carnosus]UTB79256.1 adenylyl-sulfate kinase [Staphylococcus carnosus]UTB88808.1 adenylyl-sulfate